MQHRGPGYSALVAALFPSWGRAGSGHLGGGQVVGTQRQGGGTCYHFIGVLGHF